MTLFPVLELQDMKALCVLLPFLEGLYRFARPSGPKPSETCSTPDQTYFEAPSVDRVRRKTTSSAILDSTLFLISCFSIVFYNPIPYLISYSMYYLFLHHLIIAPRYFHFDLLIVAWM